MIDSKPNIFLTEALNCQKRPVYSKSYHKNEALFKTPIFGKHISLSEKKSAPTLLRMKIIFFIIFVLSLGSALFLGIDHFQNETQKAIPSSFVKNSLEDRVYTDLLDLKSQKKLPSEFYDVSGFALSDRRANKSEKIGADIFSALQKITRLRGDAKNEVELIIFDSQQDSNAKKIEKSKSSKEVLIFQFSIINRKTKNKVAEFGRTYSAD